MTLVGIALPAELVEGHYNGFCNQALWPILHSFPSRAHFDLQHLASYRAAQERFASALTRELGPGDLVWIDGGSDVGLVTPLRDGMNLVAKEFVAAQRGSDPGVLVLSRFAGAAASLRDALLVNPHIVEETATAIGRALAMPLDERQRRQRRLLAVVRRDTAAAWSERFLAALAAPKRRSAGK